MTVTRRGRGRAGPVDPACAALSQELLAPLLLAGGAKRRAMSAGRGPQWHGTACGGCPNDLA
eukprot:3226714-Alexandrium_andersonii.AAC.1